MGKPKLIKYAEMQKDLPVDEDMAVAEFRAFYAIADVYTRRVQNPEVIAVMKEVLDNLKNNLQHK